MFYSVINFIINNRAHPRQDWAGPQNIKDESSFYSHEFTIACDLNCFISSPNDSLYFSLSSLCFINLLKAIYDYYFISINKFLNDFDENWNNCISFDFLHLLKFRLSWISSIEQCHLKSNTDKEKTEWIFLESRGIDIVEILRKTFSKSFLKNDEIFRKNEKKKKPFFFGKPAYLITFSRPWPSVDSTNSAKTSFLSFVHLSRHLIYWRKWMRLEIYIAFCA